MEQYIGCTTVRIAHFCRVTCVALLSAVAVNQANAQAQPECATVKECAQQMVAIANDLKEENVALLKRIEALEANLAKYKTDDAAALEARVAQLRKGSNSNDFPGGNGVSGICPPGKFMVGARWQSDGGGPHGIISWFGPVCRNLP